MPELITKLLLAVVLLNSVICPCPADAAGEPSAHHHHAQADVPGMPSDCLDMELQVDCFFPGYGTIQKDDPMDRDYDAGILAIEFHRGDLVANHVDALPSHLHYRPPDTPVRRGDLLTE